MAELALLAGWSFIGAFIWVFNVEAAVLVAALNTSYPPYVIGTIAGVCQSAAYFVGFRFADQLVKRSQTIRSRIERFDAQRFERYSPYVITAAGLIGVPPLSFCSVAAGLWRYPGRIFFAIIVPCRIVRFTVLASAPEWFRQLLG